MADYILEHHKADSGIVYCLSKKVVCVFCVAMSSNLTRYMSWNQDAETVAAGIAEASGDVIKTGIYHADVGDKNKESLHKRWRQGQIQVVCATIGEAL
jgi:ATP-dependent DNA helicase Q1